MDMLIFKKLPIAFVRMTDAQYFYNLIFLLSREFPPLQSNKDTHSDLFRGLKTPVERVLKPFGSYSKYEWYDSLLSRVTKGMI